MKEELQELIKRVIQNLDVEKLDKRITSFTDYKSRYVVLKPKVKVTIEMTEGKVIEMDVSDYFEGDVK